MGLTCFFFSFQFLFSSFSFSNLKKIKKKSKNEERDIGMVTWSTKKFGGFEKTKNKKQKNRKTERS